MMQSYEVRNDASSFLDSKKKASLPTRPHYEETISRLLDHKFLRKYDTARLDGHQIDTRRHTGEIECLDMVT